MDGWQELILQAAMGERSDRTWAAKRVGLSVPRQNGKSQLMVARALAGALLFGERKIVISAHQQDTAREGFSKLMEIIEADGNEALRARLDPKFGRGGVMNAFNREMVGFKNGARIQFKARSGAGGKGFSSDCLLLDEAQILGGRAWTSINSTMSAMSNPQVWLLGTPPQEEDDSEVFESVRKAATNGQSTAAAWCEWSVDPDAEDYDPASEFTRWQANPAWNTRINHEVVDGEFETYSEDRFAQDRLGVWPSDGAKTWQVINKRRWSDLTIPAEAAPTDGNLAYGVKFSTDGSRYSVAVALENEGRVHVEALPPVPMAQGLSPLADWLAERWRQASAIVVDGKAGTGDLEALLRARKVSPRRVHVLATPDAITAHASLLRMVNEGSLTHLDQAGLTKAASIAGTRKVGQYGGWGWEPVTQDGDVTPLDAVTLAAHGAATTRQRRRSGSGEAVIV